MEPANSLLLALFGREHDINVLQMCDRTLVVFAISVVLLRVAGRRAFGQKSPLDAVTAVLLGATMSRAIVGASPFVATVAASFVFCLLHRVLTWCSLFSPFVRDLVSGPARVLMQDGQPDVREMRRALVGIEDLAESLRLHHGRASLDEIRTALLERNGQISLIPREPPPVPQEAP